MKKIFLLNLFLIACAVATLTACSDDESSVSVCECEPDEYCIDDECYATDSTIAPAPEE